MFSTLEYDRASCPLPADNKRFVSKRALYRRSLPNEMNDLYDSFMTRYLTQRQQRLQQPQQECNSPTRRTRSHSEIADQNPPLDPRSRTQSLSDLQPAPPLRSTPLCSRTPQPLQEEGMEQDNEDEYYDGDSREWDFEHYDEISNIQEWNELSDTPDYPYEEYFPNISDIVQEADWSITRSQYLRMFRDQLGLPPLSESTEQLNRDALAGILHPPAVEQNLRVPPARSSLPCACPERRVIPRRPANSSYPVYPRPMNPRTPRIPAQSSGATPIVSTSAGVNGPSCAPVVTRPPFTSNATRNISTTGSSSPAESSFEGTCTFNAPDDSSWWNLGPLASANENIEAAQISSTMPSINDTSYYRLGPVTSSLRQGLHSPPQFNMSIQRSPINQGLSNATFVQQPGGGATFMRPTNATFVQQPGGEATFMRPTNATFVQQPGGEATFMRPTNATFVQQSGAGATYTENVPNQTFQSMSSCDQTEESFGLHNLFKEKDLSRKPPEMTPSITECVKAKKCGRVQFDKIDHCHAEDSTLQKRKKQIEQLVKDNYCPGVIQEAVDGLENFNALAFNLANVDSCYIEEKPAVEPLTLLEAFTTRITIEREALKEKIADGSTKDKIQETILKYFSEKHNPSDLNRCISNHLLVEFLMEHMREEESKKGSFIADMQKGITELTDNPLTKLIVYTGSTKCSSSLTQSSEERNTPIVVHEERLAEETDKAE